MQKRNTGILCVSVITILEILLQVATYGFILYVLRVSVSWQSKAQKSVTQSISGAEHKAISKAVKELKLVIQLLKNMKSSLKLHVKVRVNNMHAIFMAGNVTVINHMKHVEKC